MFLSRTSCYWRTVSSNQRTNGGGGMYSKMINLIHQTSFNSLFVGPTFRDMRVYSITLGIWSTTICKAQLKSLILKSVDCFIDKCKLTKQLLVNFLIVYRCHPKTIQLIVIIIHQDRWCIEWTLKGASIIAFSCVIISKR